jgi:enolase
MAVCRAAAAALREPLYQYIADLAKNRNSLFIPKGFFNVINGGAHAGNELDFQEFMLVPQNENFVENLRMASETYYKLKSILIENYSLSAINVGDEGGFAPPIDSPEIALGLISEAIEQANFYGKIDINLDIAASQFSGQKLGYYQTKMGIFNRDDFIDYYENLLNNYHIIGLEDPFGENDWEGFQQIMTHFSKRIMIIGDDLLATNINYIKQAQEKKACNAALIKLNQVGTITECLAAVNEAKKNEWKIIVSHRSGETIDDFIADLAVGVGADGLKAGAPARGERVCKYNRLLKIESEIYKEI